MGCNQFMWPRTELFYLHEKGEILFNGDVLLPNARQEKPTYSADGEHLSKEGEKNEIN